MKFKNEVGRPLERVRRSDQYLRPVTLYIDLDQVDGCAIGAFGCQPGVEGVAPHPAYLPARLVANRIETAARIVVAKRDLARCIGHDRAHSPPGGPGVR